MSELQRPDASLYYEVHEAASTSHLPPLMLVAGLASDSQSWQPVLEALRQERRVILLDNRGSGRTKARGRTCLEQMAQDCLALCDHLLIDELDIAGHSMGGFIALNVARLMSKRSKKTTDKTTDKITGKATPTRLRRLVLCNSSAAQSKRNQMMFTDWANALEQDGPTESWYRTFFYWILTRGFFDDQKSVHQLLKLAMNYPYAPDAGAFRSQVNAMEGFDASAWLSEIEQSTLLLTASEDLLFPPLDNASGLAAMPQAEVQVIPGLAHSLPMQAPKVFTDRVVEFLSR